MRTGIFGAAACLTLMMAGVPMSGADGEVVTVEYIAHAAFRLTAADGSSLIIDPYANRLWISYDFPAGLEATAWLLSHPHYDHDGGDYRGRRPPWPSGSRVIRHPGEFDVGRFRVRGIRGRHAEPYGEEFGRLNTIWRIEVDGVTLVHWGDNEPLGDSLGEALSGVDVLMLPIDDQEHLLSFGAVEEIIRRLSPRVLIPMHYRLADLESSDQTPSDLGGIERWLATTENVERPGDHRLQLSSPVPAHGSTRVVVLGHSPLVVAPESSGGG